MVSHDMLVKVIPDCIGFGAKILVLLPGVFPPKHWGHYVTTATQKGSAQTELGPKLEFKGSTNTLYWS